MHLYDVIKTVFVQECNSPTENRTKCEFNIKRMNTSCLLIVTTEETQRIVGWLMEFTLNWAPLCCRPAQNNVYYSHNGIWWFYKLIFIVWLGIILLIEPKKK